ncbi:MAG: efflux RND transporter periplasmic adaptor subunit [Fulvimonas sp.]|nr:efflux RND transporter periplasmic adaptor subunit [Fulvimonas sp.]
MSTPAPAAATPAATPPKSRRGLLLRLLAIVVLLALIGWVLWYFLDGRWYEETDDAYVGGNIVQVTPQIAGTVTRIVADDGDRVHAGDTLVLLDASDTEVALGEAEAALAGTVRRVRGLYSTASGAAAEVAARQVAVEKARADFERRRDLAKSGAISGEELAHTRDELTAAENALIAAKQQYTTSKVLIDDTMVGSHPDVRSAAARVRAAYLDRQRATVVAPVDGYVARRSVQLGQRVAPGQALMAVVPLHEVWVDANFKETQLTHMRIGQPVEVTADLYGGDVVYKARIESLGVGTGSAFSLLPAQNATGNWIKIVQRVPVRVAFTDPRQLDEHPLRIGLSTVTRVSLHDRSGPLLSAQPPAQPRYDTEVYARELAEADALIARIIHANMAGNARDDDTQPAPDDPNPGRHKAKAG